MGKHLPGPARDREDGAPNTHNESRTSHAPEHLRLNLEFKLYYSKLCTRATDYSQQNTRPKSCCE